MKIGPKPGASWKCGDMSGRRDMPTKVRYGIEEGDYDTTHGEPVDVV
jgi:hypothetical protein